jgi:biotin transport system substrate-specific component
LRLKPLEISLASLFAVLTALGAYIVVPLPFTPVPLTMQTFFVYLAAAILGSRIGALSMIIYLCVGAAGLPVFHGGLAGFGVLGGPTGGYIFGFILSSYVMGRVLEVGGRRRNVYGWTLFSFVVGTVVIYLLGVFYLWAVMNTIMGRNMGLEVAFMLGAVPFLPGDIIKMVIAAGICTSRRIKAVKAYAQRGK